MAERRYTEDHEWVEADGNVGTIGISEYAQEQLGDVVFVELPDSGKILDKGDEIAVVESVKAAAEVYAPVGGEVVEVNEELGADRSEEHTSELQSLMRISYAVFCLKKKKTQSIT